MGGFPKSDLLVRRAEKQEIAPLLRDHHYLTGRSKGFKSGYNYACVCNSEVIGAAIFTALPVPELVVGAFGLPRDDQEGMFELSRLVLRPDAQRVSHNLAGWFTARALKQLRRDTSVRAVLSYADTEFHEGTVYRALGFDDYGLTAEKKDFYVRNPDGSHTKLSRGRTKGVNGEWRPRSRKRRFLKVFDPELTCLWRKESD